jgi:hypothetical protein
MVHKMIKQSILKISGRGNGDVLSVSTLNKDLDISFKRGDLIRAHMKGRKIILEKVKVISDKS